MKKFIKLFFLFLPFFTKAQKDTCTVTVEMNHSLTPLKAYLVNSIGWTNQCVLDSADYKKNRFVFHEVISDPEEVSIVVTYNQERQVADMLRSDYLKFYLEKGNVYIQSKDSVRNATVKGGKINKEYKEYNTEVLNEGSKSYKSLQTYYSKFSDNIRNSKEFQKILMQKAILINKRIDSLKSAFIYKHPDYFISAVALNEMTDKNVDYTKINPLYERLNASVKNTEAGRKIAQKLEDVSFLLPGSQAINFTLADTNNVARKLSDFRGKYVLLDFWASWCGPCRAENPNVVNAYQKYKDKNFVIVGVSLDNNKEAWRNAIHKDELYWNQLSDLKGWKNFVAQLYRIQSIPQNVFIDPTGKVIAKNLRGEDLQKALVKFLR
ncbi:MAG: TlpA disulfide reductase family protein [Arachidicoccus sp.]|nr:TlpA disulfide reductase family protein [Arachidicoccus sp.]